MPESLPEALVISIKLIERLANSPSIIKKKPSVNHKFDLPLPDNRASLTSIGHNNDSFVGIDILDPDKGIDRVVVASSWLVYCIIPGGSKINHSLLML